MTSMKTLTIQNFYDSINQPTYCSLEYLISILEMNPEILNDTFLFLIFIWQIIKNLLYRDKDEDNNQGDNKGENKNEDEDKKEGKLDKGKGRATKEQEEQWYKESLMGSTYAGGDDDDDDYHNDNYSDNYNNDQYYQDETLARLMQEDFDDQDNRDKQGFPSNQHTQNNQYNKDYKNIVDCDNPSDNDSRSLSSYSIISSGLGENDDDASANKKLDLLELDERLRAEKRERDKAIISQSLEEKKRWLSQKKEVW